MWRISALRFNDLVLGLTAPRTRATMLSRISGVAPPLHRLLPRVEPALQPLVPGGPVWTDDRAPVEWVTDRMLAEQVARGQGLDEHFLPTAPGY